MIRDYVYIFCQLVNHFCIPEFPNFKILAWLMSMVVMSDQSTTSRLSGEWMSTQLFDQLNVDISADQSTKRPTSRLVELLNFLLWFSLIIFSALFFCNLHNKFCITLYILFLRIFVAYLLHYHITSQYHTIVIYQLLHILLCFIVIC